MKRFLFAILSLFVCGHSTEDSYHFAGKHFLASYLDCDRHAIADLSNLLKAMDGAVKKSGATILKHTPHVFPPHGLTVVYLLSESHASIHTYPEHGACFVDLFTCGDHCSAKAFDAALREYLQPKEVKARLFIRDKGFEEITLCDW